MFLESGQTKLFQLNFRDRGSGVPSKFVRSVKVSL